VGPHIGLCAAVKEVFQQIVRKNTIVKIPGNNVPDMGFVFFKYAGRLCHSETGLRGSDFLDRDLVSRWIA